MYDEFLKRTLERLLHIRHTTNRVVDILQKDAIDYSEGGNNIELHSAMVISDWTGATDHSWEINFHSGLQVSTLKEDYSKEINNIISRECCLMFAQSFELVERFLKDCLYTKAEKDTSFNEYILRTHMPPNCKRLTRNNIPGGDKLFEIFKKAGGIYYERFTINNNKLLDFALFWVLISKTRHAITHTQAVVERGSPFTDPKFQILHKQLFIVEKLDRSHLMIILDKKYFNNLNKKIAEFTYQIYKILCLESGLEVKSTFKQMGNPN